MDVGWGSILPVLRSDLRRFRGSIGVELVRRVAPHLKNLPISVFDDLPRKPGPVPAGFADRRAT